MAALLVCAGVSLASAQGRPVTEEFRLHEHYTSKFLKKDRDIIVWLPPGYQKETTKRYPVLYMHDGLSVFADWRLDETAAALISSNEIEPLLIVCVGNGGSVEDRYDEYTPTRDPGYKKSGNANNYGRMLVEELKPFIDSNQMRNGGLELKLFTWRKVIRSSHQIDGDKTARRVKVSGYLSPR